MGILDIKVSPFSNGTKPDKPPPEIEKEEEREKWGSKAEFLLSCIGLSVGIGNVWRFPYLAYQNGGGAFLMAYVVLLFVVGKPLYFMELAIGQFSNLGTIRVWRCFPLAKGVGFAMILMSILVAIYYNVIMCYTLYYIGQSFRQEVPWKECNRWWGADDNCYVRQSNQTLCKDVARALVARFATSNNSYSENNFVKPINVTWDGTSVLIPEDIYNTTRNSCQNATQTASEQFWEKYVLELTPSINHIGSLKWDLSVTLFVCWVIVFLGLMNGIKSSGKVVYFTATFPYVILVTLVIYGCTLPGAVTGLKYFFIPEWKKLLDIKVWRAAAEQLLFSLSIGWGCLIMYASYNRFENKLYRDAMFVSMLDFLTSLMSGIVIFAVLGNMATEMGLDISKVAKGGQGLAFVTYPEALARLWLPQLWSVLFFFMLFLLAIDSEFSYLENFFTTIYDEFPHLKRRKPLITFVFCITFFLLGLPCVTQGGQYVLNLMDRYAGGYAGLVVATLELIMIMWGYGAERFSDDLEFMLGFRPGIYWRICWKFISPVVLIFVLAYSFSVHKVIEYGGEPYPLWAEYLGWFLMMVSVLQIPFWAVVELIKNRKNPKRTLIPHPDWGPADPETRKLYQLRFSKTENKERTGIDNLGMDPVEEK